MATHCEPLVRDESRSFTNEERYERTIFCNQGIREIAESSAVERSTEVSAWACNWG
jgi:hypothetical protein